MAEVEKTEKKTEKAKLPKPMSKYIWFGASVVIALVGCFLRTADVQLNFWVKSIFAALLLFTIIVAANKVSTERFALADNKETKKQYILKSILYYVYIIVAVFYIFLSLWVSNIISV